ncbi:hypothetical protein FRC10_002598, partial [Ceratobasidium sp. 414]
TWSLISVPDQRCLSTGGLGTGEIDTSPARWGRFDYYASHVLRLDFNINNAYRSWSFLLPIKRLAATRPPTVTCPPALLPNLVSITIRLKYTPSLLQQAAAVLISPSAQLLGVESFAGIFAAIPPDLRHVDLVWVDNTVYEMFTRSVTEYVRCLSIPALQRDCDLGLTGASHGFSDILPGDYLTAVPRLTSLVSAKGFPLSTHLLDLLAGFPFLSELSLYHTPEEVVLPRLGHEAQSENVPTRFPCLRALCILSFHSIYEVSCSILSHFPVERLESLELEFTKAYEIPLPHATHSLFVLLGNRGYSLHKFSLVIDADRWDYSEPRWDIENEAYALAPWSSLSCLLGCHELRSVVVKCAGAYHGCVLNLNEIHSLGTSWPHLSTLCITETVTGVDSVRQSTRPRVVNMVGLEELSRVCPRLEVLKVTLDVEFQAAGTDAAQGARANSLPLVLDLGYSPLARKDTMNVARFVYLFVYTGSNVDRIADFWLHGRQLLSIWPGLCSLRTYWKAGRFGAHSIYLAKWREVVSYCGPSVEDRHYTGKVSGGAEEKTLILLLKHRVYPHKVELSGVIGAKA